MKKFRLKIIIFCSMLLLLPALLFVGGMLLPTKYDDTFLGELKYKYQRLSEVESPKIVLVGGSSVAFGVDSELIQKEFPEYDVVNFGMYAALGTNIMLDLSRDGVGEGDLVILMPEQQAQTLSMYFNGELMWQALDGAFEMIRHIPEENRGQLLAEYPYFAAEKWRLFLTGKSLPGEGVYSRTSFNEYGDLILDPGSYNQMPGGYDENMPILFTESLLDEDFIDDVNSYARNLLERGVTLWYHFPPMNALAIEESVDVDTYYDKLSEKLCFDIMGNPGDCILESGWFYDTNFHLNSAGKTVFTRLLIKDMKAMLGDSRETKIELPKMPEAKEAAILEAAFENSDLSCFLWERQGEEIYLTGLTTEGQKREELVVPAQCDGVMIKKLSSAVLSGSKHLKKVTLQGNIQLIEDGAFDGCEKLEEIMIRQEDPAKCLVGQELLKGTDAQVLVPEGSKERYQLNYSWSVYSDRIEEIPGQESKHLLPGRVKE